MKKIALFLVLLWGLPLLAQTTIVSGTITDANGQTYFYGTYKIEFYTNGQSGPFFWNGAPFSQGTTFSGPLDGTGSFSGVAVESSNFITPTGTSWRFTVCPAASTQCYSQLIPVLGATLNVSTIITPPAITVYANQFSQPSAYQDSEVSGANLGFSYYNQTRNQNVGLNAHSLRLCVGAVPCTWVDIGGSGSGTVGPGTTNFFSIFTSSTTIGNGPCAVFGGVIVCAGPVDVQTFGYGIEKANSASGTVCGLSVSLDSSGNAITTVNGATEGSIGVAVIGQPGTNASGGPVSCGTSGNVYVGELGNYTLTFDNQTAINDYITIGANGRFHDAGATEPTGVQVIGLVTSVNAGAGTTAQADIWTGDHVGANGTRGTLCIINGTVVAGTACNFNSTTPAAPTNFQNIPFATDNATPTSDVTVAVPQATMSQAGIIKIAQDLCGTFLLPVVCGIQTIPVTFSSPSMRDVICFQSPTALTNCPLGVPVRTVTINSDTILASDRVTDVRYTAASGATAVTLPQAGTTGFSFNFPTLLTNAQGTGTVTVTPTTSTINGASTLAIPAGFYCFIYSDNTNYFANCGQINGGGTGGGGSTSTFVENVTPDTSGNVVWTVNPFTNFRDGYWDWSFTPAGAGFPVSLYAKVRIPHVLPSGTAKIILSQLGANDATASHTMTFKVCTITVTTTLNVAAPTCTATQNFTTTTTAYAPLDLTFTVPTSVSIDTQVDIVITATAESGLTADVQMEGISFQWE